VPVPGWLWMRQDCLGAAAPDGQPGDGQGSAAPSGDRAMADVEHDHHVLGVIDLIQNSPVAAQAGL
jgi:hypothetical protein